KGRTHCQHLSTVRCWQQAGHAENGNQSNPGHLAAAVTGTAAVSRRVRVLSVVDRGGSTERGGNNRRRGSLAIRAPSAGSRSSRICDKAVRHVDAADGDVPVILLKVSLRPGCEDGTEGVAVRRLNPCWWLDHAAGPLPGGGGELRWLT